nr:DNA-directed DNA polymerase [Tanacetum cinerariifolium]
MADQRTMAKLLRAPTEGYAEAIVVPSILAEQFELKHSLINMMTTDQFFGLEKDNPHDHIRWGSPPVARKRTPATTNLRNEISNFQQRFDESFHKAWDRYKDLLRACPRHGFTELHQLDTFYNALNPADHDSLNAAAGDNLLERINQQTSVVTTAMTAMLKQFQATPPPAPVKAVEEICLTCGGAHPYYQCLAAGGNTFPELRDNIQGHVSAAAVNYNQGNPGFVPRTQIDMVKNELRNEMKSSFQTSLSNQTNEIKNIMASLLQMNTASTSGSGSLPSNTVANPKGELKAITTRSALFIDGPTVPTHPQSSNPEVDERVEETFTDPDLTEYTINVPPPPKMFKALMSNKEKLQELANTPLNENCSAVILKKLPEKLGDPGKFLIPCGFSLPELIPTRMTLELANRAICTPAGIARDVFVPVGKFTFPADFVIVDYESDPKVLIIFGRPFLRTARALIDVHGEEMILRDGDERLTLNMRHDTSSHSNQPQKESINLINVFNNSSKDFLEDLFPNQPSGNPTFLPHPELTSLKVNNDIFDSEGCNVLSEKLPDLDSTKDLHPPLHNNPLSGSTTYFSNSLLEEFADELPPEYDDNLQFDIESDLKEIEFLLYQDKDSIESDAGNVYDDPFDSKGEKIKESKRLIDELDLPCDFYPPSEYDLFISQDFSRVDALPSTNNEDKIFNPLFPEI